jgi:integrase
VKATKHHAALPYVEMPAFMQELRERKGVAARALEFLILCGVRTGDITGKQGRDDKPPMLWDHIQHAARVWTIPNTKTGKPHRVPLSSRAMEILQALPREDDNPHVFVGRAKLDPLGGTSMIAIQLPRTGAANAPTLSLKCARWRWRTRLATPRHRRMRAAICSRSGVCSWTHGRGIAPIVRLQARTSSDHDGERVFRQPKN